MPRQQRASALYLPLIFALLLSLGSRLNAQAIAPPNTSQQLAFSGLLSVANQGQFNAIETDAAGNLYLLLNQHDGIRVLKTDPTATNVLAQSHIGTTFDVGLAMAFDPGGNLYVTGTSASASLSGSSGSAFPAR